MTKNFTGTGVALVTPFNTDKSVDYGSLEKVVNHVIAGGVDFLVALGTTGEYVTLTDKEKKQVVGTIIESNKNRVPLVVGMGGNSTAHVIETIENTDFTGIDAILSVAPYYNKPSQKGLYEHFSLIAQKCPVPVILYNVPSRTASNINAETVIHLATDHSNIIAVKEASGDIKQVMHILKNKPEQFVVLSGEDSLTLPMIYLGGSGVISVIANSHPDHFSDMVKAALNKDFSTANSKHYQVLDYIDALFEEGSPAGIKAALEIMGICSGNIRLPLMPASDKLKQKLRSLIDKIA
jgi:4-hydroxy-tetrahydrodipicolinate synthase